MKKNIECAILLSQYKKELPHIIMAKEQNNISTLKNFAKQETPLVFLRKYGDVYHTNVC